MHLCPWLPTEGEYPGIQPTTMETSFVQCSHQLITGCTIGTNSVYNNCLAIDSQCDTNEAMHWMTTKGEWPISLPSWQHFRHHIWVISDTLHTIVSKQDFTDDEFLYSMACLSFTVLITSNQSLLAYFQYSCPPRLTAYWMFLNRLLQNRVPNILINCRHMAKTLPTLYNSRASFIWMLWFCQQQQRQIKNHRSCHSGGRLVKDFLFATLFQHTVRAQGKDSRCWHLLELLPLTFGVVTCTFYLQKFRIAIHVAICMQNT